MGRLAVGQTNRQIKFLLTKISNRSPKRPGTKHQSVNVVDRSQGKHKLVSSGLDYHGVTQVFHLTYCKLVSSGLDYGVAQVFSSSSAHKQTKKALTEREVQEANAHVKDRQLSAPTPTRLISLASATANRLDSFAHM